MRENVERAVKKFEREHPRLYKANKLFFNLLFKPDVWESIENKMRRWFACGGRVFLIVFPNALSGRGKHHSEIVVKVTRSGKVKIFKGLYFSENYRREQKYHLFPMR